MRLRRLALIGLAGLTVGLVATPQASGALTTAKRPVSAPTGSAPTDGIWRSDGYSTIMAVDRGQATIYETTGVSCLPGLTASRVGAGNGVVRFTGRLGEDEFGFTLRPAGGSRLVMHMEGSVGSRHLTRLAALPATCTAPAPTGPLATFDVFWRTYADNYPFFAAKGIDWSAVRDRYRPRVRPDMSDQQLFDLLVEMIKPLGDAHTGIRAGEREFVGHRPGTTFPTLELEMKVRPFIERRDLRGPMQDFGNGRIGYADLPGRIGYLRVVAFAGYTDPATYKTDAAELDRALDAVFTPARISGPGALRGLILDLRINGGGHDALGIQLASRLTRQPYLAYLKHARNDPDDAGRFTRPQPIRVPSAGKAAYTGPVAILTGGSTISAGETFAQATFGRSPRPVRIGENTQGVFSDTLIRVLPNGWHFVLPNEQFLTRQGASFDGGGIPPHVRTPVFTDEEFAADRDSAFDRALALLSRR